MSLYQGVRRRLAARSWLRRPATAVALAAAASTACSQAHTREVASSAATAGEPARVQRGVAPMPTTAVAADNWSATGSAEPAPAVSLAPWSQTHAGAGGRILPAAERAAALAAPSIVANQSWGVCRLLAPNRLPGIGGSDLGFSVLAPVRDPSDDAGRLLFLFGDTWAQATDACFFPRAGSDDLQGSLPAQFPSALGPGEPSAAASSTCDELHVTVDDPADATSWRPIRLFASAGERTDESLLDTTFLRAPVTGFSDGSHVFGVFLRGQPVTCTQGSDCPTDTRCSREREEDERALGVCASTSDSDQPVYCLPPSSCADGSACAEPSEGVCLARDPFEIPTPQATLSPDWYERDPRLAMLSEVDIATALWPDRPEDYALGVRFATNKFVNVVARTIAKFDPDNPSANDYRPGSDTLLMWGRPAFFGHDGVQAPLFLLYQPLADLLGPDGTIHWAPHFFAGYDEASGNPRWSNLEREAVPVYGAETELVDGRLQLSTRDPEFDVVNHGAMTWIEPLQRWVMFYGGSVPDWITADRATGEVPQIVHQQPVPGAIHMRSASHPWGRATLSSPTMERWSAPEPVLVQEELAHFMTCDQPGAEPSTGCTVPLDPATLVTKIVDFATQVTPDDWGVTAGVCLAGNIAFSILYQLQGSDVGHLYGANIIDEWTQDVTASVPDLQPGEKAVEVYWNVSTWNPYQVVLLKTQLRR